MSVTFIVLQAECSHGCAYIFFFVAVKIVMC